MIELKDVYKSFNGNKVLRGLSLTIPKGITVIIGKSGSGKSVLIKHCIGALKPDSGTIMMNGNDMTQLVGPRLYDQLTNVAMSFQMGALFDSMTIAENVAFYLTEHLLRGGKKILRKEIPALVEEALLKVGLEGTGDLYPSSLSGGMRKRASLARAAISQPEIIFYDEPTTGLDPVTASTIAKLIVTQHEELQGTTVVVSHDIVTTLYVADYIALIDNGVIEFMGRPEAFMQHKHPIIDLLRKSIGNDLSLIRNRG